MRTDRLAIAVYRQPGYLWSVGVVAVIRGDVGAAFDVTVCTLLKQLPRAAPETRVRVRVPGPQWEFCPALIRHERGGETYTLLTVGDSDEMCRFLAAAG